jgi:hypothetical protein
MAKLNGKTLWVARDYNPGMEPGENLFKVTVGDSLITQIKGTARPWDEHWAFYDSQREAEADANKRREKGQKSKRADGPNYDYDRQT